MTLKSVQASQLNFFFIKLVVGLLSYNKEKGETRPSFVIFHTRDKYFRLSHDVIGFCFLFIACSLKSFHKRSHTINLRECIINKQSTAIIHRFKGISESNDLNILSLTIFT